MAWAALRVSAPRVVVIGAGFAGLAAALHLTAAGARVTLIEREPRSGGKAGSWRAEGFRFDTGPTVLTMPHVIEATFAAVGRPCTVEMAPSVAGTRYRFASGRVWDVGPDLERTVASLAPSDADAYRRALTRARALYEAAAPTFVHGPAPGLRALMAYALRHGAAASPGSRLPDLLESLGVRGDLRTFFLRFATYFGADPFRAPAVLHNIAWVELGLGTRHVRGGLHAVARALEAALVDLGADVRHGCAARRVGARGGRVREVVTDSGEIAANAVVLAVDRRAAMTMLGRPLGPEREPSLSGLVRLVGVRGVDDRLAQHTVLFPETYEREFLDLRAGRHPRDPTLYLSISSRSDPDDAPVGHENRFVMANAPALPTSTPATESEERAQAGREAMHAAMTRHGFDPAAGVVVERWETPATFAAFGHRGSLYGDAPHGVLAALRAPNRVRALPDVALAGGTVHPGGGVPLALLSGRQAALVVARRLGLPLAVWTA